MMTAPSPAREATPGLTSLRSDRQLTLGIDVGGTKTSVVVTDADDRVLLREVVPTQADQLAAQLITLVRRVAGQFPGQSGDSVAAVGVAVPGHVEPHSGRVGLAVNLGGRDVALGSVIEESVGLPCYVEHDARAAATWLVENSSDAASGQDLAYISVGTGISAGIVLDGRVLRGANGLAGEIGHATADSSADPDGVTCACGLRGCLEAVAAGPAIARQAREAVAAGRATTLPADPSAVDVFRAAQSGDEVATEVAAAVAGQLGRAIRGLVLTLGVKRVIVGGGVAAAGDALRDPLMRAIGRERSISPLVEAAFAGASLELLSPDIEAGARGAASIARKRVNAKQREGVGKR